jgi:hypothetical protein
MPGWHGSTVAVSHHVIPCPRRGPDPSRGLPIGINGEQSSLNRDGDVGGSARRCSPQASCSGVIGNVVSVYAQSWLPATAISPVCSRQASTVSSAVSPTFFVIPKVQVEAGTRAAQYAKAISRQVVILDNGSERQLPASHGAEASCPVSAAVGCAKAADGPLGTLQTAPHR